MLNTAHSHSNQTEGNPLQTQSYVRVHALAVQVSEAMDDLEAKLQEIPKLKEDRATKEVDELWLNAKQKYLQLNNLGRNFMTDALKVPHLTQRRNPFTPTN